MRCAARVLVRMCLRLPCVRALGTESLCSRACARARVYVCVCICGRVRAYTHSPCAPVRCPSDARECSQRLRLPTITRICVPYIRPHTKHANDGSTAFAAIHIQMAVCVCWVVWTARTSHRLMHQMMLPLAAMLQRTRHMVRVGVR